MNGVVIVDKPSGMTSHDVVAAVKKKLAVRKAGHTGTLDPLATGVLPVCLNEATKLAQFMSHATKDYRATMLLGVETDTLDIEGRVLAERVPDVTGQDIETALKRFVGPIDQKPPGYSAVKYKGKALYKWTRQGVVIDSPPRKVEVYSLILEEIDLPNVTFFISCSAGTYIRSICADVGRILGCGACLAKLRRLRSGSFCLDSAAPLDDAEVLRSRVMPMIDAVSHLQAFPVSELWEKKLKDGIQPGGDIFCNHDISFLVSGDMIKLINEEGRLVAVAAVRDLDKAPDMVCKDALDIKILRIFHDQ
ncbi:MAG: tRNA pseudouridine(55) synthase TruB [Syntrophales bacterium]|nr:tRNA pseudouridine(55) synthase TruB [Syntrophales bacterium]